MRAYVNLTLLLLACGDKEEIHDSGSTGEGGDEESGEGGDNSDDGGEGAGTDSCTSLQAGRWATTGACFGHPMEADLSFDSASCSFSLTDWSMGMDMDVPTGGTVSGDEITLSGASWTTCTGTVSGDGASVTGLCESSGCAFGLALQ